MERYLKPQFKTDVEQAAYRQGLAAGLRPAPTVETQQRKIAKEIQQAGKNPTPTAGSNPTQPPVDHHPTNPYMSWAEFQGNRSSMGIGVNRHDYDIYVRAHGGITNNGDHDKSNQQIHKNEIGGKSIEKGIPDHTHDKIVGKITIPDRHQGKTRPVIPTPTPPAIPSAGTISDSKPAKGTPNKSPPPAKDFSRVDSGVSDIDYSPEYRETLAKWSYNNFLRQEKGLQPLPRPKPPKEFTDKDIKTLGSENSPNLDKILANSKLVLAKDKITPYMLATKSQLPYYLDVDGKREAKLYNRQGNLFDETGPRLTDMGLLGKDLNQRIKEQGWEKAFELAGVLGGITTKAGSAATRVIAQRVGTTASKVRTAARAVGRSRNVVLGQELAFL